MNHKHKLLILFAVATVGGMYFANAASGSGIYANKIAGQAFANAYVAGANLAGGGSPAVPAEAPVPAAG